MSAAEADATLTIGHRQPVLCPGADPSAAIFFPSFLAPLLFHPTPPLFIPEAFPSSVSVRVRFVLSSVRLALTNQCFVAAQIGGSLALSAASHCCALLWSEVIIMGRDIITHSIPTYTLSKPAEQMAFELKPP